MTAPTLRLHYGWHIVWSATLAIFASLGLGRFALGMLLPAMGSSLGLNYSQMGLLSTANFSGYLLAVLGCNLLTGRFGHRAVIFLAMSLVGTTMLLISRAHSFWLISLLYFCTGLGSGGVNVPTMALLSSWFTSRVRGKATGLAVIGNGLAIFLAGKLVPWLNVRGGEEGWRLGWLALGMTVVAVALVCLMVQRNSPKELGLSPCGSDPVAGRAPLPEMARKIDQKTVLHLGAIYFLFGASYVVYVTFLVTSLVRDRGFSEQAAGNFWAWVGALSLLSGPLFGTMSDRVGRKAALVTVFSIQAVAYLLAGLQPVPVGFLYASIGCFGLTAWAIPSIIAAMAGDLAGPQRAARVFGFITFIFALGQISAPAVAGRLAQHSGSFATSFLLTAGLAVGGALLAGLLPGSRVTDPRQ